MSRNRRVNDEPEEIGHYLIEEEPRSFWRPVLWVAGGGLVVAVVGVAAAFLWLAAQRATAPTVTQLRSPVELRSEATRVLADFDPSADPTLGLSPTELAERQEILALFGQFESATRADDKKALRKLIDVPRLFARVVQTGKMTPRSRAERVDLQMQVGDSIEPSHFWKRLQVAGIVPVADAPETRVVYVVGRKDEDDSQTEVRFWVARHRGGWKVYDWERLDLAMRESLSFAVIARHTQLGTLNDVNLRNAALVKFRKERDAGDHAAARTTLLGVESLRRPPEFTDYDNVVNGYYWLSMSANDDAARCFEKVSHPEEAPGAWFGLMLARRWSRPQQALSAAEKYEAALGRSVTLCETKAQILAQLGRKSEAAAEWSRVLRIDANRKAALNELLVLLPERDKGTFAVQLDKTTDPVQTARDVATMIAWRDEAALTFLIDYVRSRRPAAPELKSLAALKHAVAGDHAQAAEAQLQLLLAETDAEKQREHATSYLSAMTQLGRVVEGFDTLPLAVQPAALEELAYPFMEDESDLSRGEFEQVLARFRQRHPDDLPSVAHVVGLALRDKHYDEAERDVRAALKRLDEQASKNGTPEKPPNGPPGMRGADNDAALRLSLQRQLATALCRLGRIDEAWSLVPAESRFQELAWIVESDGPSDRLSDLIRLQEANQPNDPDVHFSRGRLAERAGRTDEAIAEYRQALTKSAGKTPWKFQHALRHLLTVTDRWQEYFDSPAYDDTQLESLAADLVRSRKWQSFDELMNRRLDSPGRARLASPASEAAWERQRYADCAEFCALALKSSDSNLPEWQRGRLRERQLAALLRQKNFDQAKALATQFRDEKVDPLAPAIVCAAAGDFADALAIAKASAEEAGSASKLYHHSEVGGIFVRDEFASLHEKFPVEFPYFAFTRTAVVLLKSPSEIDERQLADIAKQAIGPGSTAEVQSLTAHNPRLRAYRIGDGVGSASLWLVAGTGWFDSGWTLPESVADDSPEQTALRTAIAESGGYLMIGIAGWTDADREQLSDAARRLTRRLIDPSTVAVQLDQNYELHAPHDTLLDQWMESRPVGDRSHHLALRLRYESPDTIVSSRQFQHELTLAARAFQKDDTAPLEIIIASIADPVLDPLTIRVTRVSRNYNSFAFDGVLQTSSLSLPELRAGLPMHIGQHLIQAWRSGDTEFHWRP